MIIRSMTAKFGVLNGESMQFKDGLNVIVRPNESGKSTWCAFIRCMLYGVDSSARARKGSLPDKTRFAPWSGTPMEGSMDLIDGEGREITLRRGTANPDRPMRQFSAVFTGTDIPVPELNGTNAGQIQTGVTADVFSRSAFVGQGALSIINSPDLERQISSMVLTGEEDTSFDEAAGRLRTWRHKIAYNQKGMVPELEANMRDTQKKLEDLEQESERLRLLHVRSAQEEEKCRKLENAIASSRRQTRQQALENLQNSRRDLQTAQQEYDRLCVKHRADQAALSHSPISEGAPEQVLEQAKRDEAQARSLRRKSERRNSFLWCVLFLLLAAAAAFFGIRTGQRVYEVLGCLVAALAAALAVIFYRRNLRGERAHREYLRILQHYDAGSEKEIVHAAENYANLVAACSASRLEMQQAAEKLEKLRNYRDSIEKETLTELDFSGNGTESQQAAELQNQRQVLRRYGEAIAQTQGRMQALGDPMVLRSSLTTMEQRRRDLRETYEAMALALDVLTESDAEIHSRVSPKLAKCAADYMSVMTQGRYENLLISRDFSMKAARAEDLLPHSTQYLSAGTVDLLYIAVRLAVCTQALPSETGCPIILDDPFANLDEARRGQAMKLLETLAADRQILLFTCR